MKVDKETLQKNGFWIGLGSFALLWLIATLVLWITASGAVAEKQKAYDDSVKKIGAINRPKNDSFLGPWNAHGDRFRNQKDQAWALAWEFQKNMQTWPLHQNRDTMTRAWSEGYPPQFPTSAVPPTWRDDYSNKLYVTQFENLDRLVRQFPDKPPPVTFPAGLTGPRGGIIPQFGWKDRPTTEELWLAQEDFWVRRELLGIVRNVLDRVASFTELTEATVYKTGPGLITVQHRDRVGKDTVEREIPLTADLALRDKDGRPVAPVQLKEGDKVLVEERAGRFLGIQVDAALPAREMPEGPAGRVFLRNDRAGWELDLVILPQPGTRSYMISKGSTVKNIHPTRKTQSLAYPRGDKPLEFRLVQQKGSGSLAYYALTPEGIPLKYGESRPLREGEDKGDYRVDSVELDKPFEVKLVFDQDTAPIRQVSALALAAHSHRTANVKLKPDEALTKLDGAAAAEGGAATGGAATGGTAGGPATGNAGGSRAGPGLAGAGMGGDAAAGYMGGQAQAANPTSVHKLDRDRYVQVTEQTKHLPVGVVLVIEQPYLQDVLVEVANSPLRIQTTQVSARHLIGLAASGSNGGTGPTYPGSGGMDPGMDPGMDTGGMEPGCGGETDPGMDAGGMAPGGIPSGGYPGGGFSPAPGGAYPGGKPAAPGAVKAEVNADLVEVAVYGIAALYKRPTPKAPEGGATGTPGVQ